MNNLYEPSDFLFIKISQSERALPYSYVINFVDNLSENVLGNVYSLDLNYDMGLKIHGRVHSGKLRITVQTQVKLKWED